MKRIVLLLSVGVLMAAMMAASALPAFAQSGDRCTGLENRAEGNAQALEGAIGSENLQALRQAVGVSAVTLAEANEAGCTGGALEDLKIRWIVGSDLIANWPSDPSE